MLISKNQIEKVLHYSFNDMPVTSLYLNVDPAKNTKEEYVSKVKSLLHENREKLEKRNFSRGGYYSVLQDFERIEKSVESLKEHGFNALVLFSSSKNDFFLDYELDDPVTDRLVVDVSPYTNPLFSILWQKKRYIALLLKKNKLRAYEVYGNSIKEEIDLFSKSLFSSRSNAYIFTNEKKFQNRLETEQNKFLREASSEVLDLFMRKGADHIVLGGDKIIAKDFAKHMHSYLQERFAGFINAHFPSRDREVLEQVQKINKRLIAERDRELTARIKSECSRHGDACYGINNVLEALTMAAVSILAVEEGYSVPGYIDPQTGFLYIENGKSLLENPGLNPVSDVVNEAIDEAIHQGSEVRIVKNKEYIAGLDHIAALLRFPLSG